MFFPPLDQYPFHYMVARRVGLFYPWILVAAFGGARGRLVYFSPDFCPLSSRAITTCIYYLNYERLGDLTKCHIFDRPDYLENLPS